MAVFSERLKQLMKERQLRQVDILRLCDSAREADEPCVTRTDLCQYVAGKVCPRENKLRLLARALNVTEAWLLGYAEAQEGDTDETIRQYLQFVKDNPEYRMMFDLCGSATMEEIQATVAFLKQLREQNRDDG